MVLLDPDARLHARRQLDWFAWDTWPTPRRSLVRPDRAALYPARDAGTDYRWSRQSDAVVSYRESETRTAQRHTCNCGYDRSDESVWSLISDDVNANRNSGFPAWHVPHRLWLYRVRNLPTEAKRRPQILERSRLWHVRPPKLRSRVSRGGAVRLQHLLRASAVFGFCHRDIAMHQSSYTSAVSRSAAETGKLPAGGRGRVTRANLHPPDNRAFGQTRDELGWNLPYADRS